MLTPAQQLDPELQQGAKKEMSSHAAASISIRFYCGGEHVGVSLCYFSTLLCVVGIFVHT